MWSYFESSVFFVEADYLAVVSYLRDVSRSLICLELEDSLMFSLF